MDILSRIFKEEEFANLEIEVLIEFVLCIQLLRGKSIFSSSFDLSTSEDHSKAKAQFLLISLLIVN